MSPATTGRVEVTPTGRDLVLVRKFAAPIDDVWASATESDRTALWFASWSGDPRSGTVRCTMTFEQGAPPADVTIDACEPPRHLAVTTADGAGAWHLELHLTENDAGTALTFTHHLDAGADVGEVGPGWEYYLDNLVASRTDGPLPTFDDYYPAQAEDYRRAPVEPRP